MLIQGITYHTSQRSIYLVKFLLFDDIYQTPKINLFNVIQETYLSVNLIFKLNLNISFIVNHKEKPKLPTPSSAIYKYTYDGCSAILVISRVCQTALKINEHRGRFSRIGSFPCTTSHSTNRDHCLLWCPPTSLYHPNFVKIHKNVSINYPIFESQYIFILRKFPVMTMTSMFRNIKFFKILNILNLFFFFTLNI